MSQTLVDHDAIRQWADAHGAMPASVKGTGGRSDPGMIRLDFEGYSGQESLTHISWDEWFRKFDESNLALIVDDRGTAPNFNKLVRRTSGNSGGAARPAGTRAGAAGGSARQNSEVDMFADEEDDEEFEDEEDEDTNR